MKRSKRHAPESRKQQIVETVLQLVAEQGSEAVSAQLVADRIGVTQPAVFRHFPTKEAIWLAVMDWLEERLKEIFETAEPGGENAALGPPGASHHGSRARGVWCSGDRGTPSPSHLP